MTAAEPRSGAVPTASRYWELAAREPSRSKCAIAVAGSGAKHATAVVCEMPSADQ